MFVVQIIVSEINVTLPCEMSRYRVKPPITLAAITTPSGVFVICMLAGYILYAAWNRYDNVREDCRKMEELKVQAEAADVAKSQVKYVICGYTC